MGDLEKIEKELKKLETSKNKLTSKIDASQKELSKISETEIELRN